MELTGKFTIFINNHKTAEGEVYRTYSTSIGKKNEDGSYLNCSIEVTFAKKNFPDERLLKWKDNEFYVIDVTEGFLSVVQWKDGSKHPTIVVVDAKPVSKGVRNLPPVKKAEAPAEIKEELPF